MPNLNYKRISIKTLKLKISSVFPFFLVLCLDNLPCLQRSCYSYRSLKKEKLPKCILGKANTNTNFGVYDTI